MYWRVELKKPLDELVYKNETIPRPSGTVFGPGQEVLSFVYSAHREVSCKKKLCYIWNFCCGQQTSKQERGVVDS